MLLELIQYILGKASKAEGLVTMQTMANGLPAEDEPKDDVDTCTEDGFTKNVAV